MRHCSDVSLILHKKKKRYGRLIVVCYFNSYIESNLTCVIKSKQNLLFESKYDGYKALKILEVISILRFKKTVSGFTKNIRCINC